MLVVGVGRTEAKVEGLFSEVCRLDYKGNVLDAMGGKVLKGMHALALHVLFDGKEFLPVFFSFVGSGAVGKPIRMSLCGVTLITQRISPPP